MIRVKINNRHLSIRFCYTKKYALDVPKQALGRQHEPGSSAYVRVERPLTQCYIEEGTGKEKRIIAKEERKLYFKDKPFPLKSDVMEQFRKLLIKHAMKNAGDQLSREERHVLWHAFLTRHTVKPNVIPPSTPPTPASAARGMMSTRVQVPEETDTIPEERRIAVRKEILPKRDGGGGVTNVLLFPAGNWHYDLMKVNVGETLH